MAFMARFAVVLATLLRVVPKHPDKPVNVLALVALREAVAREVTRRGTVFSADSTGLVDDRRAQLEGRYPELAGELLATPGTVLVLGRKRAVERPYLVGYDRAVLVLRDGLHLPPALVELERESSNSARVALLPRRKDRTLIRAIRTHVYCLVCRKSEDDADAMRDGRRAPRARTRQACRQALRGATGDKEREKERREERTRGTAPELDRHVRLAERTGHARGGEEKRRKGQAGR